ncbi:MAG: large subunit ribosomal protein L32e [Candidatus Woesearchaeota archaeon]|jgi:large subunit ribosomal protein L32e
MSTVKELIRKIRPGFRRSGAKHIKRVSRTSYRKPKGLHNKVKDGKKGHIKTISTGYGYPVATRGQTRAGLQIVTVSTISDLEGLDSKKVALIMPSSLGLIKSQALAEAAKEFTFHHQKDMSAFLQVKADARKATQAQNAKASVARKKNKDNVLKAKQGKDKKKSEPKTAEQEQAAKVAAKKEQDKVLTTKE